MKQRYLFLIIFCIAHLFASHSTVSAASQPTNNAALVPVTTTSSSFAAPVPATTTFTVGTKPTVSIFNILSPEILGEIFKYLDKSSNYYNLLKLNKQTKDSILMAIGSIKRNLSIWNPLTIHGFYEGVLLKDLPAVLKLSTRHKKLKLSELDDVALEKIMTLFADAKTKKDALTSIDFKYCDITDKTTSTFISAYPNITSLEFENCKLISNNGLENILEKCQNLTKIDLTLRTLTGPTSKTILTALAQHCKKLESVTISLKASILSETTPTMTKTDTAIKTLAEECPNLSYLVFQKAKITKPELKALAQCKNLIRIDCDSFEGVTDEILQVLTTNNRQLKEITLRYCNGISDIEIQSLEKFAKEFKIVDLNDGLRSKKSNNTDPAAQNYPTITLLVQKPRLN